jgi:Flp pilus assembly protein TadG
VPRDERGSAVVEFVFLSVLMLIPLVYLVLVLGRVQAGAYAASTAAREAGRAFVTAETPAQAERRARVAATIAFADQGFDGAGELTITCDGTPCLRADGRVQMHTTVTVPLPLVPSFAREVIPVVVPVEADHLVTVDRFRSLP